MENELDKKITDSPYLWEYEGSYVDRLVEKWSRIPDLDEIDREEKRKKEAKKKADTLEDMMK